MRLILSKKNRQVYICYCVVFNWFLLNYGLCFSTTGSSSVKGWRSKRQSSCDSTNQFTCTSGACINSVLLCDGVKNCPDGSDETSAQCKSMRCPGFTFKCEYGACVDSTFRCDGIVQCADKSDESTRLCGSQTGTATIKKPSPVTSTTTTEKSKTPAKKPSSIGDVGPGSCKLPSVTPDKIYTVSCATDSCNKNPGELTSQFTSITFNCEPGYQREPEVANEAVCLKGIWQPSHTNCTRICEKLNPRNVNLKCVRKGAEVNCTGNLYAGTEVTPTCENLHIPSNPFSNPRIRCNEAGKWSAELLSCVPVCGQPYNKATTLIFGGKPAEYGKAPWHVAIYDITKKYTLICGGTIVTPHLVLSAAHCFYDQTQAKSFPEKNYEIVVSKYTRNHSIIDNEFQKTYKVNEIRYSKKGYFGLETHYASDIVLLVIDVKIVLSPTVLPACMEWVKSNTEIPPGTLGNVVGWGIDDSEKVSGSQILLSADLPYINYTTCFKAAPEGFKQYITEDKFCAGTPKGPGVRQGDSGGGILFKNTQNSLYYVRGVVSIKDNTESSIAAFTDVAEHIDWILEVRSNIEAKFGN